jgi:glycosyltransferase involved in cell wall biosynthesis
MNLDPSALIVIPTTGASTLADALKSVTLQTYKNIRCLVVIDGPQYQDQTDKILKHFPNVAKLVLPWNIGANGWYGHRVYFMSAAILQEQYWFALDQDNWYDNDHVESMIHHCESNNLHWCHSLRKIYDTSGNFICYDNCESLGRSPIFLNDNAHLVDTSTYCIRKEVIVNMAPAWYSGWGGDRRFYAAISQHVPNFGCTKKHSVCYRLDGNPNSVNAEFFLKGNEVMSARYPNGYPWLV